MSVLEEVNKAVLTGKDEVMPALMNQALAEGIPANQILQEGLLAGMSEIGRLFRECEYFIPEVLVSAGAMKAAMQVLRPHLAAQGVKAFATAIIGTVKGDLHDIGKSLVAMMLEGAGFEVVDLGVDVPAERFVETCRSRPVDLVAISALLTTTMPEMVGTVRLLRQELGSSVRIMVGGSPVTLEFAVQIGADGYGKDAATGADVARQLCTKA